MEKCVGKTNPLDGETKLNSAHEWETKDAISQWAECQTRDQNETATRSRAPHKAKAPHTRARDKDNRSQIHLTDWSFTFPPTFRKDTNVGQLVVPLSVAAAVIIVIVLVHFSPAQAD
ncbi:hypothetical protein BaRGS_00003967, partial [Batillaria attramentaria]